MEYLPTIKSLIKTVIRKLYEPHHCVIIDIILQEILINDIELQKKMKMSTKEINKLLVLLKKDKIIKSENKVETTSDNRKLLRTVFYINYVEVRDIIKYKIYNITKRLDENMKNSVKEGYVCVKCNKQYDALDAQLVMNNYLFICDECNGELVECSKYVEQEGSINKKFMDNVEDIIEILKVLDKYQIPSMDFFHLTEFKKEYATMESKTFVEKEMKNENFNLTDIAAEQDSIINLELNKLESSNVVSNFEVQSDIIYVCGIPKQYSEITDEDVEKMDEKEYEKYYEIYEKYNLS